MEIHTLIENGLLIKTELTQVTGKQSLGLRMAAGPGWERTSTTYQRTRYATLCSQHIWLDVMSPTFNANTLEAEAGGAL